MLNQKKKECQEKVEEINDLQEKFKGQDQKLNQLLMEIDQYRF